MATPATTRAKKSRQASAALRVCSIDQLQMQAAQIGTLTVPCNAAARHPPQPIHGCSSVLVCIQLASCGKGTGRV